MTIPSKQRSSIQQQTIKDYLSQIEPPAYVIDENIISQNLAQFADVKKQTGCKILLATKAYSCFATYPQLAHVLDGTTNSSLNEVRLSHELFGKETHVYAPAYKENEFSEISSYSDVIVFNSVNQYDKFKGRVSSDKKLSLRLNPEHIEVQNDLYSPCVPGSRFGILAQDLQGVNIDHVSGLHIHALCQNDEDSLERLIQKTEEKFADLLYSKQISHVNFGGGHMVSRLGYNQQKLCTLIHAFQDKYQVQIVLEPGESVVYNAGYLVSEILDIVHNIKDIAILDTSATAHMPDVLEMPYTPFVLGSGTGVDYKYHYRFGGLTCLSGDVIGEYTFKTPLHVGDKVVFTDMAQYTMVKNTHFNGIKLPSIYVLRQSQELELIKSFNYNDFKQRLG